MVHFEALLRHHRQTFPDMISVDSDDDDDSTLASVASAHEAFVVRSVSLGLDDAATANGIARLVSNWNLKSNLNVTRSSRVLNHSQIPLSRSLVSPLSVLRPQSFSGVFLHVYRDG